jgi:hypothetical protein
MLRVTRDVIEIRRWAELHGGRPCREEETGRIVIAFEGDTCVVPVGWEEFEPAFCTGRFVFVYDDTPGTRRVFVGAPEDAERFAGALGGGWSAAAHDSGP